MSLTQGIVDRRGYPYRGFLQVSYLRYGKADISLSLWKNIILEGFSSYDSLLAVEMLAAFAKVVASDQGFIISFVRNALNSSFNVGDPSLRGITSSNAFGLELRATKGNLVAVFNRLIEPSNSRAELCKNLF